MNFTALKKHPISINGMLVFISEKRIIRRISGKLIYSLTILFLIFLRKKFVFCDITLHYVADIINTAPVFYIYFTGKNRTVMAEALGYGFNMYFVFRQNGCIGIPELPPW